MQATLKTPVEQTTHHGPSLLDQITERQAEVATRYQPVMPIEEAIKRQAVLSRFMKELLVKDIDYGEIPGTSQKPVLLKPGAEKVCAFFGYVPRYETSSIEDWTGAKYGEPLFYYRYMCWLEKDGHAVGSGEGSANSWESKYRYRWQAEPPPGVDKNTLLARNSTLTEPDFAVKKGETAGKYGKPAEYWQSFRDAIANGTAKRVKKDKKGGGTLDAWEIGGTMFRVPNPDFADVINTCQKMGQKRAMIAAVLTATGLSQYFTQDLDDSPGAPEPHQEPRHEEPPPQRKPEPEPELSPREAMLAGIVNMGAAKKTFSQLLDRFRVVNPAQADKEFRRILFAHCGHETAEALNKGIDPKDIKAAAAEMWDWVTLAESVNVPPPTSPSQNEFDKHMAGVE